MDPLSPLGILREKEAYALEELKKDEPLLILVAPHTVLCISASTSKSHQKVMPLVQCPGALVILCARGDPSDLVVFKNEIRRAIIGFEQMVDANDLSGRMIAMTAATILRNHYLKEPKALAVHAAFLDLADPEDPVCVISPTGDQFVGTSFLLKESEIMPVSETPQTLNEMKEYAKTLGIPAEGQEHVWVFVSGSAKIADVAAHQENSAQPKNPPEQSEQIETAEYPSTENKKSET